MVYSPGNVPVLSKTSLKLYLKLDFVGAVCITWCIAKICNECENVSYLIYICNIFQVCTHKNCCALSVLLSCSRFLSPVALT